MNKAEVIRNRAAYRLHQRGIHRLCRRDVQTHWEPLAGATYIDPETGEAFVPKLNGIFGTERPVRREMHW